MATGNIMMLRLRIPRHFSSVRSLSQFLVSGGFFFFSFNILALEGCLDGRKKFGIQCAAFLFVMVDISGTQKRSHGLSQVLTMLWSPLECSLTRRRLLPTWRYGFQLLTNDLILWFAVFFLWNSFPFEQIHFVCWFDLWLIYCLWWWFGWAGWSKEGGHLCPKQRCTHVCCGCEWEGLQAWYQHCFQC